MQQISVRLTDNLLKRMDAHLADLNRVAGPKWTRAELLRAALVLHLDAEQDDVEPDEQGETP